MRYIFRMAVDIRLLFWAAQEIAPITKEEVLNKIKTCNRFIALDISFNYDLVIYTAEMGI